MGSIQIEDELQAKKTNSNNLRTSSLERQLTGEKNEGYDLMLLSQPEVINYLSYSFDRLVNTTTNSKKGSGDSRLEKFKKAEEEVGKILNHYYQVYGFTAGGSSGGQSETHGFGATYTTNLVNTFRNVTYFTQSKTNRDNLVSPISVNPSATNEFSSTLGNTNNSSGSNFYTKTLVLIQNTLNKSNKGSSRSTATINSTFFPRPRRVLNFLYLPFVSRPLNEVNCRQAITAIQTLLVDYPTDSIAHTSYLISWYLAALNTTSPVLKDLIIERLTQLVSNELEKGQVKLLQVELDTTVFQLLHHLSLTAQLSHSAPQRTESNNATRLKVHSKIDKLLKQVAQCTDRNLNDHFGSKTQGMLSMIYAFAKLLANPNLSVQQFALTTLLKETWPDSKIPLARPFYSQFAVSAHALFSNYVISGDPTLAATAAQVLQLLDTYYPANHLPTEIHDRSTWYLVVRSALLAFAIGIDHAESLNRPTSSMQYLETRSAIIRKSRQYLQAILGSGGNDLLVRALDDLIRSTQLQVSIPIYSQVVCDTLDLEIAESVLDRTLPTLYSRCFDDHLLHPSDQLRNLLMQIKVAFPKALYKPLLKLVPKATPSEGYRLLFYLKLVEGCLTMETTYLTELDLISVVLFSPLHPKIPVTLGQVVFVSRIVVLIDNLSFYSDFQKQSAEYLIALKSLLDLEKQLTMLILARKKLNASPLHPIAKLLVVNILVGIRHLTQPKRRLGWIGTIVEWVDTKAGSSGENYLEYDFGKLHSELQQVLSIESERGKVQPIYHRLAHIQLPDAIYRQNGLVVAGNLAPLHRSLTFGKEISAVDSNGFVKLTQNPVATVFKLLAAVYSHLTESEYLQLLPTLHLHGLSTRSMDRASAQLLYLLAGERVTQPTEHFSLHRNDSPHQLTDSVDQLHFIFLARRSLLSLLKVIDLDDKPFRKWHVNLQFVPTAVGSYEPVLDRSVWLDKLRQSGTSLDEIRMIQSLGWDNDPDQEEEELNRFQVGTRPVTLASTSFQEIFDELQPDLELSKAPVHKRKPLFTNTVCQLVTNLLDHLSAYQNLASSRLDDLCFKMMRDEPTWLLRLVFNQPDPTSDSDHISTYPISRLNQLIQLRPKLPFQFAYYAFNYLLGYLKFCYRERDLPDLVVAVAGVGVLSRLLHSTVDVNLRNLRKLKLDPLLFTDGTFLLKPSNPYFHLDLDGWRHLDRTRSRVPRLLLQLTTLRITQINFMAHLLRLTPHDVQLFTKFVGDYQPLNQVLLESTTFQQLNYRGLKVDHPDLASALASTSALGCQAWLSLLEVSLQSVDPNLQDRDGLQVLLKGVTTIIKAHPHHLPLVARSGRLLVQVAMQFRRLFNIDAGYSLFIVGLFETYHHSKSQDVKVGIQLVVSRFYNLHTDSFLFQMLGELIPFAIQQAEVSGWVASLFQWFEALQSPPPFDPFNVLKQKRVPTTVTHSRSKSKLNLTQYLNSRSKQIYNTESTGTRLKFGLDGTLKLLVTIIAYDPNSLRSQQFVTVLAHLLQHFLRSPVTHSLIDLAVKSLLPIFKKLSKRKAKLINWMKPAHDKEPNVQTGNSKADEHELDPQLHQTYGKQWLHNDTVTIRMQLFQLIGNSVQLGGGLDSQQVEDLLYILKSVLKSDQLHQTHYPQRGTVGPLTTFVTALLTDHLDPTLKLQLINGTFALINGYLDTFKTSASCTDLVVAVQHLAQKLDLFRLDSPYLNTEQATMLKVLTHAHRTFVESLPQVELDLLKRFGLEVAKLVECLLLQFPEELAFQFKATSHLHPYTTLYVWIPFLTHTKWDDAYLTSRLDPILQVGIQRFYLVLCGKLLTSVHAAPSANAKDISVERCMDFLLALACLKLTLVKLNRIVYLKFPTLQRMVVQVLVESVFVPYTHPVPTSPSPNLVTHTWTFALSQYACTSFTLFLSQFQFPWLNPYLQPHLNQVTSAQLNPSYCGSNFTSTHPSPIPTTHSNLHSISPNLLPTTHFHPPSSNLNHLHLNQTIHSNNLSSATSPKSDKMSFSRRLSNFKTSINSNSNSEVSTKSQLELIKDSEEVQSLLNRLLDKAKVLFLILTTTATETDTKFNGKVELDMFDEAKFLQGLFN